ncbi:M28 family peptidase [Alsobacter sp. SYSU M60028]|uniref:M28 family peptidase n=1 Tax=Alsobacter ponti TaxID=2962936 RepID=A0ABT1LG15_9HYPH|nr:M28 family peptidase [Alsobacter ponti]MCP8940374.1 M28 family peptidase [Alsobacter ponti]
MSSIDAEARDLVSETHLMGTCAALCALGEKVAGKPEEEQACKVLTDALASYGIETTVHRFQSYISHPVSAALSLMTQDGPLSIQAVGVAFGLSTPAGGVTAPLVDVGDGDAAGYVGKDVKGKIALVGKLPSPHNALLAAQHGAIGMVSMSAGKQRHKMIITPVWGTPEFDQTASIPKLHVVSISGVDGARIREALAKGPVTATLEAEVETSWREVRLPVAEIKGSEPEFLLVGAHYCSWFDGSTDNVTGDACVLELARVIKQFEGKLRYGVKLAWWPGHSHGRYSGSTWFADTFFDDLHDHAIVYFNIDSPGVRGATVYVPRHQMAEVGDFNEAMTKEITGWSTMTSGKAQLAIGKRGDKYVSATRPSRAADQSFWGIGLSSMSVYSMLTPDHPDRDPNVGGSGGAWWWHSEHETIDKIDPAILAQDTRLYASILLRMATADVLPFRPSAIAQDYLDSLREYRETAGDRFDFSAAEAAVRDYRRAAETLEERLRGVNDDAITAEANRLFLRLTRTLNPVLYQDLPGHLHDPALGSRSLPSLKAALTLAGMDPASDRYRFTVAGLRRRLNHVVLQVKQANALIDAFLARPEVTRLAG